MEEHEIFTIYDYDSGGGYDWATVQLGIGSGKSWIRSGAGCSCDSINQIPWEPLTDINQIQCNAIDSLNIQERITAIPSLMEWLPGSATQTIREYAKKSGLDRKFLEGMLAHHETDQETKVILVLRLGNSGSL